MWLRRSRRPSVRLRFRASRQRASGWPQTKRSASRAYRKARAWLIATPAAKVAEVEASFFPNIDRAVLTQTIATYQKLGNWTPHVEITRPAFEVTLDVFEYSGLITKRHKYEDVIALPPA
jgi:NitT/TauT family transport system substrate-binding protein